MQSRESLKILTVRTTSFDAVADHGGSASIEHVVTRLNVFITVRNEFSSSGVDLASYGW